ncbi:MAG: hypothetical protein CL840_01350 [Crocinitomicaceae bacterium]|nr:hypothetical protein [Crocinitomicaceae bacterium]|tara:strand:+ start:25571 stop:25996 length:426 start_codon:yes stop_codon:yes gene_type:complete
MSRKLAVDEFEDKTDQELNQALAELTGEFTPIPEDHTSAQIGSALYAIDPLRRLEACHPDYTDNWEQLMELAIEHGAFVSPLAWERSEKRYRAQHIAPGEGGRMTIHGTKYMSDDDDPARALVMTLIKILRNQKNEDNTTS